jgi:ABC-2 type transport system ATP-binding protein
MVIRATGLTKVFTTGPRRDRRRLEAVRALSLVVEPGERVAFIGPNGAGKSTSIKILTGILHPSAGEASVLGVVPWEDRRRLAGRIGTLFGQRSQLWSELSPRQSYRMLAAVFGLTRADEQRRVGELGELLDAGDLFDRPVRTLSLGQRMRCELAACLLHAPAVLFLDEPTIGLDLLAKQRFREVLVRLNAEHGTTIFLTSHDVADIEHVAERVVVVNHGSVIYDDDVATMRRTLLATKLVDVHAPGDIAVPEGAGVRVVDNGPGRLRVSVDTAVVPVRDVLDRLLDTPDVSDVSVVDPPLEQLIAEIYALAAPEPAAAPRTAP